MAVIFRTVNTHKYDIQWQLFQFQTKGDVDSVHVTFR